MSYSFCPRCGNLLLIRVDPDRGTLLKCRVCTFNVKFIGRQVIDAEIDPLDVQTLVAPKKVSNIIEVQCENCGNNEAYYKEHQTRSADEPTTFYYQCTKCMHTWQN